MLHLVSFSWLRLFKDLLSELLDFSLYSCCGRKTDKPETGAPDTVDFRPLFICCGVFLLCRTSFMSETRSSFKAITVVYLSWGSWILCRTHKAFQTFTGRCQYTVQSTPKHPSKVPFQWTTWRRRKDINQKVKPVNLANCRRPPAARSCFQICCPSGTRWMSWKAKVRFGKLIG